MRQLILVLFITIFTTGCSNTPKNIEIQKQLVPQKTEVKVIECNTANYHKLIDKTLKSNDPDKGSIVIGYQWQLINELYSCIERQQNEIRSKQ